MVELPLFKSLVDSPNQRASIRLGTWVIAFLASCGSLHAADPASPHPHQGVIEAFEGKPALPDLGQEQLATLAGGEAILITSE